MVDCFWILQFHGTDSSDLSSGVLSMGITPPNAVSPSACSKLTKIYENNDIFEMLLEMNDGRISLPDWQKFLETKAFIPATYSDVHAQLRAYKIVLGSILSINHATFYDYQAAVLSFWNTNLAQ